MARRTALQADETRMSIIRAAGRVFCAAGFAGTTLEEIARNAGVTRGAVYWHFENKHNVLERMPGRRPLIRGCIPCRGRILSIPCLGGNC
jgi:TetR/AcrR family acrAB operon transcriptional repressor